MNSYHSCFPITIISNPKHLFAAYISLPLLREIFDCVWFCLFVSIESFFLSGSVTNMIMLISSPLYITLIFQLSISFQVFNNNCVCLFVVDLCACRKKKPHTLKLVSTIIIIFGSRSNVINIHIQDV